MKKKLGPRDGSPSASRPGSLGREEVLRSLRAARNPLTIAELGARTGLHVNTVRAALDELLELGTVSRSARHHQGRGRPSWEYAADGPDPNAGGEYVALAGVLARTLAESGPSPARLAIDAGRQWGTELIDPKRAIEPVHLLRRMGFDPVESDVDTAARTVRLTRCPLLKVAIEQPEIVCSVHLGMVQEMAAAVGDDPDAVTLEPFAEPGACVLQLPMERLHRDAR